MTAVNGRSDTIVTFYIRDYGAVPGRFDIEVLAPATAIRRMKHAGSCIIIWFSSRYHFFTKNCRNKLQILTMREARLILDDWIYEYNGYRPHGSLGGLTPDLFQEHWEKEHGKKQAV